MSSKSIFSVASGNQSSATAPDPQVAGPVSDRPGGKLAKRALQILLIMDTSSSMCGRKIESLNLAMREAIKPMQDVASENPNADVLVRVLRFATDARWHVEQPTPIHDFRWIDLDADGTTSMGQALQLVAEAVKVENMPMRGLPPVIVLVTDGMATDNFDAGLTALLDQPWGRRAIRMGLAIGDDADLDAIERFIANPQIKPLRATNVQDLVKKIQFVTTVPLKVATNPLVASGGTANLIPTAPADTAAASDIDVF